MRLLDRFLKSQTGMTMTEMVVGGGIAAVAALGAASLLGGMSGGSRDAEMVIEKTQFASNLGVYLNTKFGCTDLQTAVPGTFTDTDQEMSLTKWKYRMISPWEKDKIFSDKYDKDLYLKSFTGKFISLDASLPTVTMSYKPDGGGAEVTEQLTKTMLRVRAVVLMNEREYPHEFNIPVMINSAREIKFCGDNKTIAETCGSLGGKFDTDTGECKLKETCQIQGSFVVLTCSPNVNPQPYCDQSRGVNSNNPVTGFQTCPPPSVQVSMGGENWTIQKDCGKKCTIDVNNSLRYVTCMHCPL